MSHSKKSCSGPTTITETPTHDTSNLSYVKKTDFASTIKALFDNQNVQFKEIIANQNTKLNKNSKIKTTKYLH